VIIFIKIIGHDELIIIAVMETGKYGRYFYYVISVLFLIIGLFGINRLTIKADLPFTYSYRDNHICSDEQFDKIKKDEIIQSLDGINIKSIYQLESLLDRKSIGEDTELEVRASSDSIFKQHVHLVRYYRNLNFILISLLVGLSFWAASVFLIFKKYGDTSVFALFWVLMLFSAATMTSPGKYFPGPDITAFIVRAFHVSTYFLGAVAFFHFTLVFPRIRISRYKVFISILYLFSFLFSIVLVIVQILSVSGFNSEWIFTMEELWNLTEILLLIMIFSGGVNLYLYNRNKSAGMDKNKTEWIFWGLAVGACPFLLLWLLPRVLGFNELIPEEYLLAFMILVPVFFATAVIKYHVFEIDVFIKKSILYSSLTFITLFIYFALITVITFFANDLMKEYSNLLSVLLILLIAFIFNPLQNKLRQFIDRIFYREKYNFEKTVSNFTEGIKDKHSISELSRYVISQIGEIIPVKKIALVALMEPEDRFRVLSQNNFTDIGNFISVVKVNEIISDPVGITALKEKVEPGILPESSLNENLKKWEINIIFPFVPEPKDTAGALILGNKLSELRYTMHDIELLNVLISNISLAFKKLQLQRKVLIEEMEISRLEEINKMMAYYVSSVSHDLKTPLTSIKIFTEILKEQTDNKNGNSFEYLNIIEGESDRLSRLINNVLNFAKIENGIKEYAFERLDLNESIKEVLKIMEYQLVMDKFDLGKCIKGKIFITADKDALKEILINLISNSIKYSLNKKVIRISSRIENEFGIVKIEDEGIGIAQDEIKNIFKPFIRSKNSDVKHTGGAGIGLSIVKSIIDAHKGRIKVESTLGKGSSFSLYFRLSEIEDMNEVNKSAYEV